MRELNANDSHDDNVSIEYIAWTGTSVGGAHGNSMTTGELKSGTNCWNINFNQGFTQSPTLIASIDHSNINGHDGKGTSEHDAIFSWVERVTAKDFRICASESSYDSVGAHNPITIN